MSFGSLCNTSALVNAALKRGQLHSKHAGCHVSSLVFSREAKRLRMNFCFCSSERKTCFNDEAIKFGITHSSPYVRPFELPESFLQCRFLSPQRWTKAMPRRHPAGSSWATQLSGKCMLNFGIIPNPSLSVGHKRRGRPSDIRWPDTRVDAAAIGQAWEEGQLQFSCPDSVFGGRLWQLLLFHISNMRQEKEWLKHNKKTVNLREKATQNMWHDPRQFHLTMYWIKHV